MTTSINHTAIPFDNNVECQVCRAKIKASLSQKRWDGFIVCASCNEPRHPLDKPLMARPEDTRPKVSTGRGQDVETDTSGWTNTLTDIPTGNFTTNNETL